MRLLNQYKKNKHQVPPCDNFELLADSIQADEGEFIVLKLKWKNMKSFWKFMLFIARLPVQYQEIITLRFFERQKIQGNCRNFGETGRTVKACYNRALEKLRKNDAVRCNFFMGKQVL